MDNNWEDILALLAPQATYGGQERAITDQLAQAYAMRNRPQTPHTTGAGAAIGGIGDILTMIAGQKQANTLEAKRQTNMQGYQGTIADIVRKWQQNKQMPQASEPYQTVDPTGGAGSF